MRRDPPMLSIYKDYVMLHLGLDKNMHNVVEDTHTAVHLIVRTDVLEF